MLSASGRVFTHQEPEGVDLQCHSPAVDWRRGALILLTCLAFGSSGFAEAAAADYRLLDQVLLQNVRDGYVDYDGIRADPRFGQFLGQLGQKSDDGPAGQPASPEQQREDQLALFINAYNAFNIDASLDGVEEILTALLDISKLDSGAMKPEFTVFPINELLDQLRIDFEPIAKSRGISLSIVQSYSLVRSDRKLLRRILQNLISNALKYNKEKGAWCWAAGIAARRCWSRCTTRGPEFPSTSANWCSRSSSAWTAIRRGVPGLGLGLSIVDRMCRVLNHELGSQIGARPRLGIFGGPAVGALAGPGAAAPLQHAASALREFARRNRALPRQRPQHHRRHEHACWPIGIARSSPRWTARRPSRSWRPPRSRPTSSSRIIIWTGRTGSKPSRTFAPLARPPFPAIIVTADGAQEVRQAVLLAGHAFLPKPLKPAALRALISQMIVQRRAAE